VGFNDSRLVLIMTMDPAGTILGVPVDGRSLEAIVVDSLRAIDIKRQRRIFACANAHSVVIAQHDPEFMMALKDADIVVADGVGITAIGSLAGIRTGPHITGQDYFNALMQALNSRGGGRVFFFGSSDDVLEKIVTKSRNCYPSIELCGLMSPPFRDWSEDENNEMVEAINRAKPDILWVGMTAPKQEKWVARNHERLSVPVIGSIGAVFDFFSASKPSAPLWMRKWGLEWLYRSVTEPRRLGSRNLSSIPVFVAKVVWKHVLLRK
jgi:N-acetylglucosaminyldiphosphoundecaprenol N-acetyl-beta-D-mannosaminyltransferase